MIAYLLKRLGLALLTLFAILAVSYALLRLAPGDPTRSDLLGGRQEGAAMDAEKGAFVRNASLRKELDLDLPVAVGFARWLTRVVRHGDFGRSASVDPGRPVAAMIAERLPVTVSLNLWAILITYLLAIPAGVYAATRAGGIFDRSSTFLFFILYSLPVMWVGLLLQALLCEGGFRPLFPLRGAALPDRWLPVGRYLWELSKGYFLPILCLSYAGLAGLSRYARSGMLDALHADYVRTARAKGLPESRVIWSHAFRNTLITLITLFGGILPSLVAGSVLVEYIFNIPGMGTLALLAMSSRDYPLQMALFTFAGALTLAGILLADLCYMAADPRIHLDS